jgi:hypothetical protein
MPQEAKDNSFVLFTNDKGDNPKRPDYTGKMTVAGREFVISGWKRKSKDGKSTYLSGKVEPKKDNGRGYQKPKPQDNWGDDNTDADPF